MQSVIMDLMNDAIPSDVHSNSEVNKTSIKKGRPMMKKVAENAPLFLRVSQQHRLHLTRGVLFSTWLWYEWEFRWSMFPECKFILHVVINRWQSLSVLTHPRLTFLSCQKSSQSSWSDSLRNLPPFQFFMETPSFSIVHHSLSWPNFTMSLTEISHIPLSFPSSENLSHDWQLWLQYCNMVSETKIREPSHGQFQFD